jgi:predicted NBD/HSP70 family sugar kinase
MKNNVTNSAGMKYRNRQTILSIISRDPISRAELARKTGLTRAAISIIVDDLIDNGIILEIGATESECGRKPVLLDIKSDCFFAVGVDISRAGCRCGIVDLKGKVRQKKEININSKSVDQAVEAIGMAVNKLVKNSGIPKEKILGIGVSCPGPVDISSGTVLNPPNFDLWHGVDLVGRLKKKLDYSIYLENISMSLAIAEKNFARGTEFKNFILLAVDDGIGAGIIIDNKPYRGARGFGGEIGHTSIDMNGRKCSCGNRGCVEIYGCIPSILKEGRAFDKSLSGWSDVVDRAEAGVEACISLIDREARYLSHAVVNAMNILDLEALILTGAIGYKPDILSAKVRGYIESMSITRDIHRIEVTGSLIEKDSGIISASVNVIDRFFSS